MDRFSVGDNLSTVSLGYLQYFDDLFKLVSVHGHLADNFVSALLKNSSAHRFLQCYRFPVRIAPADMEPPSWVSSITLAGVVLMASVFDY
jgi:hypothetical protein